MFENYVVKLWISGWLMDLGSLEIYSSDNCKYPSTKIPCKTTALLAIICFFSNEDLLMLLGDSEAAVFEQVPPLYQSLQEHFHHLILLLVI